MKGCIVLCRPPYSGVYGIYKKIPKDREVRPPLGLMYLAAVLEKDGWEVKIIDGEPELLSPSKIADLAIWHCADFVGISSTTPEYYLAQKINLELRWRATNVKVVIGGFHASALPEDSLKESNADYIVVGEGEQSILKIVNELPKQRIIKSVLIDDLDSLPRPARHLVDYSNYRYPIPNEGLVRMDAIETTRGCPYHCIYCSRHLHGSIVRYRDSVKCVDEIEDSIEQTKARLLMFYDETFSVKRERVVKICEEILRRKLDIQLFAWTRADALDYDLLKLMKRAGFNQLSVGVESGNQQMLNTMRKGEKLEQFVQVFDWLDKLNIEARGSFIIGTPGETEQSIMDSINFARRIKVYRIGVNIMTPYPGSPLYNEMVKGRKDIKFASKDWRDYKRWGSAVIDLPVLKAKDLLWWQRKFLRDFNSSHRVLWYHFKQLFKGNWNYYYYRPILYAIRERGRCVFK